QHNPTTNIAGSTPFERRAGLTCDQCLDECRKWFASKFHYTCKSVTYDFFYRTCDLHAVVSDKKQYNLVHSSTCSHFVPTGICSVIKPEIMTVPSQSVTQQPSASISIAQQTFVPTLVEEEHSLEAIENVHSPSYGQQPTIVATTDVQQSCAEGQKRWIASLKNYDDKSLTGRLIAHMSKEACFSVCRNNLKYYRGIALGLQGPCQSVVYNENGCRLSDKQVADFTSAVPSRNSEYGVVLCVSAYSTECGKPMVLGKLQTMLVGFAQKVVPASNYNECMSKCFKKNGISTSACKSGMYFFATKQCVLNSESSLTHSEALSSEPKTAVLYFEDGCHSVVLPDDSINIEVELTRRQLLDQPITQQWTAWSLCSGKNTLSVRYQKCNLKDCPKETRKCEDIESELILVFIPFM
ncbi:unnamed protein product, partial [Soboliphyme baturini]|uniref:Apple domain-containing protein n=1 Tax=Soboliphyme baturini TaxID=241478 RepID=A0A183J3L0_9BILA